MPLLERDYVISMRQLGAWRTLGLTFFCVLHRYAVSSKSFFFKDFKNHSLRESLVYTMTKAFLAGLLFILSMVMDMLYLQIPKESEQFYLRF